MDKKWWSKPDVKAEAVAQAKAEAEANAEVEAQAKAEAVAGLICPQCRKGSINLGTLQCDFCDWQGEIVDGVLILLSDRGKTDPLLNRYSQIYDQIALDDISESIMETDYLSVLAKRTAKTVGENLAGKKGCDIGSGKGLLLNELIKRGADVTAVDIAMPYLKQLKMNVENLECVLANAEELPFRERFDFITCTDVMEHVLNISNFLFCLNEALKPGGTAIVRVPFRENLVAYATQLGCNYDLVHLRSFTEQALKDTMVGAGFEIVEVVYSGFSLSMHLPRSCDDNPKRALEVTKIRSTLQDRGITYDELDEMPNWFVEQICRPYELMVSARKTRRLEMGESGGFVLAPFNE